MIRARSPARTTGVAAALPPRASRAPGLRWSAPAGRSIARTARPTQERRAAAVNGGGHDAALVDRGPDRQHGAGRCLERGHMGDPGGADTRRRSPGRYRRGLLYDERSMPARRLLQQRSGCARSIRRAVLVGTTLVLTHSQRTGFVVTHILTPVPRGPARSGGESSPGCGVCRDSYRRLQCGWERQRLGSRGCSSA